MISDEELLAQSGGVPTMYVDGFGAFRKINGVLRCVGYVIDGGAQLNLIVSLAGADAAQADMARVLREAPVKDIDVWRGNAVAH
jgi:hypothetical protein